MYNAYHDKADVLGERFNTGEGAVNLRELEHLRATELKAAQEECKAAGNMFVEQQADEQEEAVVVRKNRGPRDGKAAPQGRGPP